MADENIVDEVVDTKVVDQGSVEKPVTAVDSPEPKVEAKDGKPSTPAPAKATSDWPDDWRQKAAGGDEKRLKRLERYASPTALADALIAAQNKISTGDLKPALGKDAKPEEISAYREAHGIPEEPGKYDLTGIEIGTEEKPLIDAFLKSAHGANMTPDQVKASLSAYYEISENTRQERIKLDEKAKQDAEDNLRSEWGQEYRTNINLVTNLLDTAPQGLREKFFLGRLADGTPIGSSPEVLRWLTGIAREKNPAGVVVPAGQASMNAAEDEIAKIEKTMRENRTAYNKDEKMQSRYRELLAYRENQKGRKAA